MKGAIVYALSRSPQVEKIYCAPGNAGIAQLAECVAIKDTDVEGLLLFAKETEVDLTVVGPEAALAAGVVDAFRAEGMPIFGHTKAATQIESSKEFAKIIMDKYNVPTAGYQSFSDYNAALEYVKAGTLPTVLKYDGLAAGKGVVIATTLEEADAALQDMLCNEAFGKGKVVIEDYLEGPEFSFMCFVNGENVYPMPLSQDHKRAYDNDEGPNTGGMGAYTPLPFVTEEDEAFARKYVLEAVAKGMCQEGLPLTGVLYGGLMKTANGIKYNRCPAPCFNEHPRYACQLSLGGGRTYSWRFCRRYRLAYSRGHSVYGFCGNSQLHAEKLRAWLCLQVYAYDAACPHRHFRALGICRRNYYYHNSPCYQQDCKR